MLRHFVKHFDFLNFVQNKIQKVFSQDGEFEVRWSEKSGDDRIAA